MNTMGDILRIVGMFRTVGGYHEYGGGIIFCYLSISTVLMLSPTVLKPPGFLGETDYFILKMLLRHLCSVQSYFGHSHFDRYLAFYGTFFSTVLRRIDDVFSDSGKSLDLYYCVGIGDCIENTQSTIVENDFSFNFHQPKLHFFKNCGVYFTCCKGCFPEKFETYAGSIW